MKAAVFHGAAQPLNIEDVPMPELGSGEVLIKVAACGLCRTDLHYLHGTPTFKKPPIILGHEVSGIVEDAAPDVISFKNGSKVIIPPVFGCGKCFFCRTGRPTLCTNQIMLGNHRDGGFAEYVSAPASELFIAPDNVPLEEASIISDAISTPYHAVVNRAEVKPGDTVAVFGCGGVGLSTIQMAAAVGGKVIAIDVFDQKLESAKIFGAWHTINGKTEQDVPKAIRKMTGGGVDVALEVIGNPITIQQAFNAVRWGGRVVVVGYSSKEVTIDSARLMFREIEIKGSLGCGPQDYPRIIEMVRLGRIRVKEMVTHKFKLEEINDGFKMLDGGEPTMIRGIAVP